MLKLNTKERYFEEQLEPNICGTALYFFSTMEVNGSNRSLKYLPLCSAEERNSYRFAKT